VQVACGDDGAQHLWTEVVRVCSIWRAACACFRELSASTWHSHTRLNVSWTDGEMRRCVKCEGMASRTSDLSSSKRRDEKQR
jgi:hypothetical protein